MKKNALAVLAAALAAALIILSVGKPRPDAGAFVDDRAGVLTEEGRRRVAGLSAAVLRDLDIHIKTVTLEESPGDLNIKTVELFEEHALGGGTRGARGVLFVVDPKGQRVRVETGYDLEAVFPDGFVGYLERRQMAPFFREGRVGAGVEAAVELLVGRAMGEVDASAYNAGEDLPRGPYLSGGGGASSAMAIGSDAPVKEESPLRDRFGPQPLPEAAMRKYIEALELRVKDPWLGLYTPETREFLAGWTVNDAQQENELRGLYESFPEATVFEEGGLAVVRFPVARRGAPPYFLRRGEEGWMLDLAAMGRLVGFNHKNQWFFRDRSHEYMFAFQDLRFDANGFPHRD
ncbi:MAG: hypothetical protein Kow0025_00980 [Thermodesulfovibrionales bacterium]